MSRKRQLSVTSDAHEARLCSLAEGLDTYFLSEPSMWDFSYFRIRPIPQTLTAWLIRNEITNKLRFELGSTQAEAVRL